MSDQVPESGTKRTLLLGGGVSEKFKRLMTLFATFVPDFISVSRAKSQPLGGSSPPPDSRVVDVNEQTNGSGTISQPLGGSSTPPESTVIDENELTDTDNQSTALQDDSSLVDVPGELLKLNKMILVISGAAVYAVSSIWPIAANVVAFTATLIAVCLNNRWRKAALILTKFGAMACAFGILAALAIVLPEKYRWYAVGPPFVTIAAAVYAWHP